MKLIHYDLENEIDFDSNEIWTIVCEQPKLFVTLTEDLHSQTSGLNGKWRLFESNKELDFSKYIVYIADYYGISLNDRKSAAMLQDNLKRLAYDEKHLSSTNRILTELALYMDELTADVDYPVTIRDADISNLLKIVGIAFLEEYDNLFEKLIDYVTLIAHLTNIKIICLINLRSYVTREQLSVFFEHCITSGINVLCIENHYKNKLSNEKILFCDEDMCEYFPQT